MADASIPELNGDQQPNQLSSPEALANDRFIAIYRKIIDEYAYTKEPKPGRPQFWVDLLPRIPGWEPTKFDDIENAVNRIHVTKSSGHDDVSLDQDDIDVIDLDPKDNSKYWAKIFHVGDGRVSLTIDHMRVHPGGDEPKRISSQEIEQAPVELLNSVADEIETILTWHAAR